MFVGCAMRVCSGKFQVGNFMKTAGMWRVAALAALLLGACATGSRYPYHSFGFDLSSDGQDAVMLDYRYGTSRQVSISASPTFAGKGYRAQSVAQPMPRGEYVYLKWQSGKQAYEDTIDLRNRLP